MILEDMQVYLTFDNHKKLQVNLCKILSNSDVKNWFKDARKGTSRTLKCKQ